MDEHIHVRFTHDDIHEMLTCAVALDTAFSGRKIRYEDADGNEVLNVPV